MNYALIKDGIVANIIWLSPSNAKEFPDAVPISGLPVEIGDTYADGAFYRSGVRVTSAAMEADAAQTAYEQGVQEA